MRRFFEKWYVLFMLMRIARHNKIRRKFEEKYDNVFEDYGQQLEYMWFTKCLEKDGKLYKTSEANKREFVVARKPHRDDFGLYEYVDQQCGYCEDDFYGTIYTKTPIKGIWLKRSFHC